MGTRPLRYARISETIRIERARTLLEVGTWDGGRAIEMMGAALEATEGGVVYDGFDLFEQPSPRDEFNVKPVAVLAAVEARIGAWVAAHPGAAYRLHQGDTRVTLRRFSPERSKTVDFAWLDGGHSVETIRSDWESVRPMMRPGGVVLLDDFYQKVDPGLTAAFGVNDLVGRLFSKPGWRRRIAIYPERDPLVTGGQVSIVRVDIPE